MKENEYRELVHKRKSCRQCVGLRNPSEFGQLDSDEMGPWSVWQGSLDAQVIVIGQDWGDQDTFQRQEGKCSDSGATNKNLKALLESIGLPINGPGGEQNPALFFTNSILCLKSEGLGARTLPRWYHNCNRDFLKPLAELIQPQVVITLGGAPYRALLQSYDLKRSLPFREAVEQQEPFLLPNNIHFYPVYHCGQRVTNTIRPLHEQYRDWGRIRKSLDC